MYNISFRNVAKQKQVIVLVQFFSKYTWYTALAHIYISNLYKMVVVNRPVISGFQKSSADQLTAPEHWEG